MDVKQEIQKLKDDEQQFDYPTAPKKDRPRIKVMFNLWPLFPILMIVAIMNIIMSATEASSFWNYWWVIFLIKPISLGWGKMKSNRPGICLETAA